MEQKATTPAMHAIGRVIIGDSLLLMMTMLSYTHDKKSLPEPPATTGASTVVLAVVLALNMTGHAVGAFSPRLASAVGVKKKLCKSEE